MNIPAPVPAFGMNRGTAGAAIRSWSNDRAIKGIISLCPSLDSGAWKESRWLKGRCGGSAAGHHLSPTFFIQPASRSVPPLQLTPSDIPLLLLKLCPPALRSQHQHIMRSASAELCAISSIPRAPSLRDAIAPHPPASAHILAVLCSPCLQGRAGTVLKGRCC